MTNWLSVNMAVKCAHIVISYSLILYSVYGDHSNLPVDQKKKVLGHMLYLTSS